MNPDNIVDPNKNQPLPNSPGSNEGGSGGVWLVIFTILVILGIAFMVYRKKKANRTQQFSSRTSEVTARQAPASNVDASTASESKSNEGSQKTNGERRRKRRVKKYESGLKKVYDEEDEESGITAPLKASNEYLVET